MLRKCALFYLRHHGRIRTGDALRYIGDGPSHACVRTDGSSAGAACTRAFRLPDRKRRKSVFASFCPDTWRLLMMRGASRSHSVKESIGPNSCFQTPRFWKEFEIIRWRYGKQEIRKADSTVFHYPRRIKNGMSFCREEDRTIQHRTSIREGFLPVDSRSIFPLRTPLVS